MPRSLQGLLGLLIFLAIISTLGTTPALTFVGGWCLAYVLVALERIWRGH